jgi:integrase
LQDAGVPINVAKYLMGHSDISLTARIYTHTTDDVLTDALEKINAKNKLREQKNKDADNGKNNGETEQSL